MKTVNNDRQRGTPTPADHRRPIWRHPAYLGLWEHLPYGLQIRLMEIEGRLDRIFRRRLKVHRRSRHVLQRAVLIALIGAAVRAIIYLWQRRY
ncbi:hypothetical protein DWV00_21960 [Trinickia dinghuensis]|uniref:Uncharacterized protein n=1 Tax=Trinickia dinghuensis TaxID=2291023 RepID=A0A3D8JU93_9BURK|nr:hypothetical protein DWV00_21960 [Trinickia dinghuensis]